jgi:ribosomal protein S18 acetylase RimI-like enzyme
MTTAPLTVEEATVDDVEAVTELWVELAEGQRAYGSDLLSEGNRTTVRERLARQAVTGGLLVARGEADRIVGFVTFEPEQGSFEKRVTVGVVQNIYVVPERRDEGIGSELLADAERRLYADGAEVVTLEAMADNERAVAFYRRHGYRPHRVAMRKNDTDSNRE